MSRLLVVYTHCFELCAVALLAFGSWAVASEAPDYASLPESSTLTRADQILIERGKEISRHPESQDLRLDEMLGNPNMGAARKEARAFVDKLQHNKPLLRQAKQRQQQKKIHTDHSVLVFASRSLGDEGLDDMLMAVSGRPDAVMVFRGIPEGMSLGDGIKAIQAMAASAKPVPNIIIDPTLFKKYNVTSVPTIVVLEDEAAPGQQRKPVARVAGLSDPTWLLQRIAADTTGDQGTRGPTEAISEPDLIEVAKKRMANIDWDQQKKQARENFWKHQDFHELPRAHKPRTRNLDPSILITQDITANDGTVIAAKGDRINPLDARPFDVAVVIFDPLDKKQMALLDQAMPKIKQEPGVSRVTYIATRFDQDKGWDSYTSVTDHFDAPVFLLTPDIIQRFELEYTPSVITAAGDHFVIRELAEEDDEGEERHIGTKP